MGKRFKQLKSLSLFEWRLLLTAMVLLPIVALFLRLFGYRRTKAFMARSIPAETKLETPNVSEMYRARIIARMVGIAAGHGLYRASCLRKSLLLWWLLARRGIRSEIRIGVAKESQEEFGAHAWVECGGEPLYESDDVAQRFTAFKNKSERKLREESEKLELRG